MFKSGWTKAAKKPEKYYQLKKQRKDQNKNNVFDTRSRQASQLNFDLSMYFPTYAIPAAIPSPWPSDPVAMSMKSIF